jgi:hypothetical protein
MSDEAPPADVKEPDKPKPEPEQPPAAAEPVQNESESADPAPKEQVPDPDSIVKKSNKGGSRERKELREEAMGRFNRSTVHGPAVAGDAHFYLHGTDQPRVSRIMRVDEALVEEIRQTFVLPTDFATLLGEAEGRRLILVKGAPHIGRYAAARYLLSGSASIHGVEVVLTELAPDDLVKGGGHIKRELTRQEARALTGFRVGELTAMLERADARLVVTLGPTVSFADATVADLVFALGKVQDRRAILESQLLWRVPGDVADAILDDPEVVELVERELGGDGPPEHARKIAVQLAKAYKADLPWARTAADALKLADAEKTKQWFRDLRKLSVQTMAVAVSVLGGESYEFVAAAAERLRRQLAPQGDVQRTKEDLDEGLVDTKDEWLAALGAQVVSGLAQTRHGSKAPTELVRFSDDHAQEKVLVHFFSSFDEQRPALLLWLRGLAASDAESIRYRVATAIGILTARSYELVRTGVILPWASSPDPRLRDAASLALAVTANELAEKARDQEMREAVRSTVSGWTDEGEREWLRATAARSWLVEYQAGGAEAALRLLDQLGDDESLRVIEAVCQSFAELWEEVGEDLEAPGALLEWIDSRKPRRVLTARLAFLVSAIDLIHEPPGGEVVWPKLLHIAASNPQRMRELGRLWQDALKTEPVRSLAKEVLRGWVGEAEEVPAMRQALGYLLLQAAADPTTNDRIRFEADKWAKDHPIFAAAMKAALARKAYP